MRCRAGDEAGAKAALEAISADMNIIENFSYHRLCLFYKGELTEQELIGDDGDTPSGAATVYGLANWHYVEGNDERAEELLEALVATDSWSAFGFIAAEADLEAR